MKDVKNQEIRCEEVEGIPIYYLKDVSSTMDVADEFLKEGKTGIVVAERQEKGRGRYGRRWFSPLGGLYLSWILKDDPLFPQFLSEMLSLSVVETLRYFGIDCRIKLPNDIIINGKKIAGILIMKKENWYIAGIGININNPVEDEGQQVAVKDIIRKEVDKDVVLEQFIKVFLEIKSIFYRDTGVSLKMWSEYLIK